ncbi:hypothetical protein [Nonomuraea terrae]|uniref:hypothetical protein n=1 Tax=Nonomuraea terrae TaxID=2530383 RepID=UPI001CB7547D|nr:hypothetical protein [Nonomuraea terrae]
MRMRAPVRTGMRVSRSMMFGRAGNPDHDACVRVIHRAFGDDALDRIGEIVPPGTDLGPLDVAYDPPAVTRASPRRRPVGGRAAA